MVNNETEGKIAAGENKTVLATFENFKGKNGNEISDFEIGFSKNPKDPSVILNDRWKLNRVWINDGSHTWYYECHCWIKKQSRWKKPEFIRKYPEKGWWPTSCPNGTVAVMGIGDRCFKYQNWVTIFDVAQDSCRKSYQEYESTLFYPVSSMNIVKVEKHFKLQKGSYWMGFEHFTTRPIIDDYMDIPFWGETKKFQPISFEHNEWAAGYPKFGNSRTCGCGKVGTGGLLRTCSCTNSLPYICEVNSPTNNLDDNKD
ncbi:uncharacterized protein LOC142357683 [Convolutriloba macropyga]|uniref:uncharacterized protein LOC142357683 n=1 Tax=Convolutriloba macropyga TaxID=536237 RepID=UPI003F51D70F